VLLLVVRLPMLLLLLLLSALWLLLLLLLLTLLFLRVLSCWLGWCCRVRCCYVFVLLVSLLHGVVVAVVDVVVVRYVAVDLVDWVCDGVGYAGVVVVVILYIFFLFWWCSCRCWLWLCCFYLLCCGCCYHVCLWLFWWCSCRWCCCLCHCCCLCLYCFCCCSLHRQFVSLLPLPVSLLCLLDAVLFVVLKCVIL